MSRNMQNQYVPDNVSPPGETLQETLDVLGMSQAELAKRTGRPTKTINGIIKGKEAITPQTALQLERVLGVPASFWSNRERDYREALARQDEGRRLEKEVSWLKRIPVAAMIKSGWIESSDDKVQQLREVLGFFGIASPKRWSQLCNSMDACFRHSPTFKSHMASMYAWLRKGEIEAQHVICESYDDVKFKQVLVRVRELTLTPPEVFVSELQEQCRHAGVAVLFVRALPKVRASGATRWLSPDKALIQLSLRHKSDDHLWFSFFHEAGHILHDRKRTIFVDEGRSNHESEQRANRFAENMLIPAQELSRFIKTQKPPRISKPAIRRFADDIGLAPGVVVGRLQHQGLLPHTHCNDLKQRFEWVKR